MCSPDFDLSDFQKHTARIRKLPPLPFFDDRARSEALAIITEAQSTKPSSGTETLLILELVERSVHGREYERRERGRWRETPNFRALLCELLVAAKLDEHYFYAAFANLVMFAGDLTGADATWWALRHEDALEAFRAAGLKVRDFPSDMLVGFAGERAFGQLIALGKAGVPRLAIEAAALTQGADVLKDLRNAWAAAENKAS